MNIFFRAFQIAVGSLLFAGQAFAQLGSDCTKTRSCASGYICLSADRNNTKFNCVQDQSAKSGAPSASTGAICSIQFQKIMTQCQNQISATDSNCDEKSNSGMNDVTSMAGQVALAFGAQSAASIQQACSSAAALTTAANAALAAYRLTCSSAIKDCQTTCQSALTYLDSTAACKLDATAYASMKGQAQSSRNQCNNYTAKINEAQQAMTNIAGTAANATQCASLTSADGTSTLEEICKSNPTMAGCSTVLMDCNNPSMASNKVCICSKNPSDPACLSTQSAIGDSNGLGTVDNSSRLGTSTSSDITGDIPDLPTIAQGELPSGGGDSAIDGKQGGGVSFGGATGGSSGSGSGNGAGGAHADPNGAAVNSGFYGGGAGGSFGGGGSEGSGGGGGLFNAAANALAAKGGPDLRQFLPGGKMAGSRGIAGATGPDGITGPNSDIWKKVQNRYQVMQPSLLP